MMKKPLVIVGVWTLFLIFVVCRPPGSALNQGASNVDVEDTSATSTPAVQLDTPTPIVLATPTAKSAPPTPTPIPPTPTPTEQPAGTASEETGPTPTPKPAVLDMMIEIPAGPFIMGSDNGDPEDAPAHEVDLPAFEIDKFEVINVDFATFVEATGYKTFAEEKGYASWRDKWQEDNHPVVMVTWDDANAYCTWLGKRLPTEAEWEKAARDDDERAFPWGNEWDPNRANVKEAGLRGPVAMGSFGDGASPYDIMDMTGNVWEWTADWYQPYPGNATPDDYYGETFRVTRGGGWFDEEAQLTTFNRNAADPEITANDDLGFRCVR
jgi:iron(II)-dependent oxidoreductase